MTPAELVFTELAELSTVEIARQKNATGVDENSAAGKEGGAIARRARLDFEKRTKPKWSLRSISCPARSRPSWKMARVARKKRIKVCRGRKRISPPTMVNKGHAQRP